MELDNIQSIIIDNGGDTIKAGFNLDCFPYTVFPNVRGGSRDTSPISQGRKYNYVGNEALEGEKFLTLTFGICKYPVSLKLPSLAPDRGNYLIVYSELQIGYSMTQ